MWDRHKTVAELIEVAVLCFDLPTDNRYELVNTESGKVLGGNKTFRHWRFRDGHLLEMREVVPDLQLESSPTIPWRQFPDGQL
jgi:hypothetical protein